MTDRPFTTAPRRVALVVGGGGGLGAAVVQALAQGGWAVAIHAHASFARARETAEGLAAAGVPALAVTADLRDEGPVRVVVRRVADHFGRLDAVVHCVTVRREMPLADLTADDLRAAIDVGLVGAVVLAQEAAGVMARQETGGTIVLVGDRAADSPLPGQLAAAVVAGAIPAAARALAAEFATAGVRVHALAAEAGGIARAVTAVVGLLDAGPTAGR
jgi:NAD(P)-dependent dehydrogenase (short-subunit alcohol dehydrogenase family)